MENSGAESMGKENQYSNIRKDGTFLEDVRRGQAGYPIGFYFEDVTKHDFHCIDWHWHPEYEFVYVEKGKVDMYIAEDQFALEKGCGIFINSSVLHHYYAEKEGIIPIFVCSPAIIAPEDSLIYRKYVQPVLNSGIPYQTFLPGIPWQKEILKLLSEIFAAHFPDHACGDSLPECPDEAGRSLLPECPYEAGRSLLPKYPDEAGGSLLPKYPEELYVTCRLQALWGILYEHIRPEIKENSLQNDRSNLSQIRVQRMLQYIQEYYTGPVTLDDIAGAASVSKSSCLNIFHRYLHTTPVEYLTSYRLKQATLLLQSTQETLDVIAEKSGFESVSYFCRQFKKIYGMTPGKYRKKESH